MSKRPTCNECDYFDPSEDEELPNHENMGYCRRYAPRPIAGDMVEMLMEGRTLDTLFPMVNKLGDWCGEFCKRFHFDKGSVDASEPK